MKNYKKIIVAFGIFMLIFNSCRSADECPYEDCIETTSINVSTGVSNTGGSLASATTDPFWTITPSNSAKVSNHYIGFWEITPVATTNAGWIYTTPR